MYLSFYIIYYKLYIIYYILYIIYYIFYFRLQPHCVWPYKPPPRYVKNHVEKYVGKYVEKYPTHRNKAPASTKQSVFTEGPSQWPGLPGLNRSFGFLFLLHFDLLVFLLLSVLLLLLFLLNVLLLRSVLFAQF